LAILVENGGHGGSAAAPMAKAMFEAYLLNQKPEAQPGNDGSPETAGD
jgi:penicillin-binding protein 2